MIPLLALLTAGWSAEVTDIPPGLTGDLSIAYVGSWEQGSLQEDEEDVGTRRVSRHDLTLGAEFSPLDGFSLSVALPITPSWALSFPEARTMSYDPVTESGTYASGAALDAPAREARGLQGVWIGVALAPFSERLHAHHQVSWRLDAAVRPGSKKAFWIPGEDGVRGAAPGGTGVDLSAAFSTERGTANPYLAVDYRWEGALTVAEEGGAEVEYRPASGVVALAGVELVGARDAKAGTKVAFDMRLRFGYTGPAAIPSGVLLPGVLEASKDLVVTHGEHVALGVGLGLKADVHKYVAFRLGGDLAYVTPHRLEHVYPVYTGLDTMRLSWGATLVGRYR